MSSADSLPSLVLTAICARLDALTDRLRMSRVCKHWHNSTANWNDIRRLRVVERCLDPRIVKGVVGFYPDFFTIEIFSKIIPHLGTSKRFSMSSFVLCAFPFLSFVLCSFQEAVCEFRLFMSIFDRFASVKTLVWASSISDRVSLLELKKMIAFLQVTVSHFDINYLNAIPR